MKNRLPFLLLGCCLTLQSHAAAVQDLRQLEQLARVFVAADDGQGGFQYQSGRADPRLRLPACTTPPLATWPAGQHPPYSAVALGCPVQGWQVLLPVSASENSMGYAAARPLRAGEVLQQADIKLVRITNRALLLQAVRDPARLLGKAMRSSIPADSLLRESLVREPIVVKMNQPVRVEVVGSNFSIGSEATALGNAALGERVNVRTVSGKVVSGVVQPDLTIQITMP